MSEITAQGLSVVSQNRRIHVRCQCGGIATIELDLIPVWWWLALVALAGFVVGLVVGYGATL